MVHGRAVVAETAGPHRLHRHLDRHRPGRSRSFVILLTNRVHPSRNWGSNNPARRAVARDMALAIPVRPQEGRTAWFSGVGDARTATLSVPVQLGSAPSRLTFDLWYDTEPTDVVDAGVVVGRRQHLAGAGALVRLVRQAVGQRSRWTSVRSTGDVTLRWRYTSDALYQGRGVYVDGIRVTSQGHIVFDDSRQRDADAVQPAGWSASAT